MPKTNKYALALLAGCFRNGKLCGSSQNYPVTRVFMLCLSFAAIIIVVLFTYNVHIILQNIYIVNVILHDNNVENQHLFVLYKKSTYTRISKFIKLTERKQTSINLLLL